MKRRDRAVERPGMRGRRPASLSVPPAAGNSMPEPGGGEETRAGATSGEPQGAGLPAGALPLLTDTARAAAARCLFPPRRLSARTGPRQQTTPGHPYRAGTAAWSRVGCGGVGVCWLFVWFWVWWPFFGLVLFWLLGVWLVGSVGRWRWLAGGLVVLSGLGGVGGAGCGGVVGGWCWWCWFCGGFRGWLVWVGWCFRVSVSTRRGGGGRRGVLFRRS